MQLFANNLIAVSNRVYKDPVLYFVGGSLRHGQKTCIGLGNTDLSCDAGTKDPVRIREAGAERDGANSPVKLAFHQLDLAFVRIDAFIGELKFYGRQCLDLFIDRFAGELVGEFQKITLAHAKISIPLLYFRNHRQWLCLTFANQRTDFEGDTANVTAHRRLDQRITETDT